MSKKKSFKRWRAEYEQLLVNNTPATPEDVKEIEDVELFDAWADNLTPREYYEDT